VNPASEQKVLVVDPDAAVRALIVTVLRRDGYAADTADSADAALHLRRSSTHAAVVVDPRILGGEELLQALQSESTGGSADLIVMTTPDRSDLVYTTTPGVRAVLIKPFVIDDLAAAIASCCHHTSGALVSG
jgi:DNA-binding response OmpR family regulator